MTDSFKSKLQARIQSSSELEQQLEILRFFKRENQQKIRDDYKGGSIDFLEVSRQLSDLADAILQNVLEMAIHETQKIFGHALSENSLAPSQLAIIGMGKLGGHELHFHSDLDLIFIFKEHGETQGLKKISNREFFSRATQRVIHYLSLYTRGGYGYQVDTELRPSGNVGALVSHFRAWAEYYQKYAALWERQALLKARVSAAENNFALEFNGIFEKYIFFQDIPTDINTQMHHLRTRIEKELAKECEERWNLKKGYGALVDVEFAVQFLQLQHGKTNSKILLSNTREALMALKAQKLLTPGNYELLLKAYDFYRSFEIEQEIFFEKAETFFTLQSDRNDFLARRMNFDSPQALRENIKTLRHELRKCYLKILDVE